MPELPEVETIARSLREPQEAYTPSIIGLCVQRAQVLWGKTVSNIDLAEFEQKLTGQTVIGLSRRGKFLVFNLSSDTLLIHLRMSGDLRLEYMDQPILKHDRLLVDFKNGTRMAFNDTRKFGRAWLTNDPADILGNLGPEPLSVEFTPERLHGMLAGRKRQLKPLLMDQHFIAGLGNIYTDEALHLARLHPLTHSDQITQKEATRLHSAIQTVLREGIRRNGASIDWVYKGGDFQNHFRVYGRAGEPCPKCGADIQRLVVGQRGTHICPNCQKPG
jgi:formamidopyrimidine-DNA glycosylase